MEIMIWVLWAILLIAQNFAFTFVSRARNSASLTRHIFAAQLSNGVWFCSQVFLFGTFFKMMTGVYGVQKAILTGVFYTTCTTFGSVLAHFISLRTEKGKTAVGANQKYAQITQSEWSACQKQLESLMPKNCELRPSCELLVKWAGLNVKISTLEECSRQVVKAWDTLDYSAVLRLTSEWAMMERAKQMLTESNIDRASPENVEPQRGMIEDEEN